MIPMLHYCQTSTNTTLMLKPCDYLNAQFIQPLGTPSNEVMQFSLPAYCSSILPAVAHYLRQNLLIFLHLPKYTDSNMAHHFKVNTPHHPQTTSTPIFYLWKANAPCHIRKWLS